MRCRPDTAMPATRLAALLAIVILLWTGAGAVLAQDPERGEMTVSVRPSGAAGAPGQPVDWTGNPAAASAPSHAGQGRPAVAPPPIGTVSASVALLPPAAAGNPSLLRLGLRDDRGTGAGWTVRWHGEGRSGPWRPFLLVNRPDTIIRLLPVGVPASDPGVRPGRVLGNIPGVVTLVHAEAGSGTGVFRQDLLVMLPAASGPVPVLVLHLTTGP